MTQSTVIPPLAIARLERLRDRMKAAQREADHYRERRTFMEAEVARFMTDIDMAARHHGPLEVDDQGRIIRFVPDTKGNKERVPSLDHIGTQINTAKAKVSEYRDRQYEAANQAGPLRDAITSAEMGLRELGWKPDAWHY